jgi:hypothetical protein
LTHTVYFPYASIQIHFELIHGSRLRPPNAAVVHGLVKVPDVDEREPGLSLGYWSIRVIEKTVQPIGGPHSVSDFVFKRDADTGAWVFIERKIFYIAD